MAYVNVAEWKTEQVCEWLKGLDNSVLPYVHSFTNNKVNGQQLLSLRPEDLEQLGVFKLGHQEIILEAVEYLRNFHYELDRENLQLLALRLSCQAHSLYNELCRQTGSKPVTTQTLSDVVAVVTALKPLVRWLDRPPFSGQLDYNDKKTDLLKLSIEMSTCAQRDRFAEKPIEEIRNTCGELARLADYIIQDISDPMILQPSSLDLATLKKRPGDELGFYVLPSFHGTHQIAEIKFGSSAHQCGKMEEGDEIVQVNYQTVVGWERKNVLELFNESPAEVLLTLKRRPRHTKVYGQIYIKPYRLPSNKKTSYTTRWQHNLPSPRPELLTIPDFTMPLPRNTPKDPTPEPKSINVTSNILDTMTTDSSDSDSEVEPPSLSGSLYATKPRTVVQRRATITGASPVTKDDVEIEQLWRELKQEHNTTFQLRDKAASCAHGLDNVPPSSRPQTCIGIEQSKRKKKLTAITDANKNQFNEKSSESPPLSSSSSQCAQKIYNDTCIVSNTNSDTEVHTKCQELSNDSGIEIIEGNNIYCKNDENTEKIIIITDNTNKTDNSSINVHDTDNNSPNTDEINMNNEVQVIESIVLTNKRNNTSIIDNNNGELLILDKNSDNCDSSRESSQEKSESTSSYMEAIYSSSSEADTPIKFDKIHTAIVAEETTNAKFDNTLDQSKVPLEILSDTMNPKECSSPIVAEKPKKIRQTPPEPPPRKYFTKPSPLNLKAVPDVPARPKVPDRPDFKLNNVKRSTPEATVTVERDCYEGYRDFIEKSQDFIDESIRKSPLHHSDYSEIREKKDDKLHLDKYELFTEKFGSTSSIPIIHSSEHSLPTADSPDGARCSRQAPTPELKSRTLEKDKHYERGVVNRAMMVARSIGLHSASKVTSASPRSSRKRNILLAKRRNVSVKDIGPGDLEGWLTYRSRGAGGAWARSWFILKGSSLYRFKTQDSVKSDCLIVLPGFTASQAAEVKSRKYAFKVYHTGTVFYFAADTDDCLSLWLDSINKATLGADTSNRTSGLFSETDESDTESKSKVKGALNFDTKEKTFGSLKKLGRKDTSVKEQETGASLDRKYLKFLGARTQNVPVPTAQFRSYRRVLPTSTPNRKQESNYSCTDRVTVAGSTFYDVSDNTSPEMGDYRQSSDRIQTNRLHRPDDLRGFVTLEEFMLSQNENRQRTLSNTSASPRVTPSISHHYNLSQRNFDDTISYGQNSSFSNGSVSNGMIYGHPRNGEDTAMNSSSDSYGYTRQNDTRTISEQQIDTIYGQRTEDYAQRMAIPRKMNDSVYGVAKRIQEGAVYYPPKQKNYNNRENTDKSMVTYSDRQNVHVKSHKDEAPQPLPRRFVKDNGYSGSSGDLTCYNLSETFQRAKKEASISRKGSFNHYDGRRDDSTERNWIDSLRRSDKKSRLKNVAQYQPPPIPTSPFDESMRPAFEMHLDKGEQTHKPSRLKSLFSSGSNKSPQKPATLELSKEPQKTLLGSPRLHRALFRDKSTNRQNTKIGQNDGKMVNSSYGEIAQSHSFTFNSINTTNDWSSDVMTINNSEFTKKPSSGKNPLYPPTLPYIPPPTSPPPPDDYPGLEYPPVFEPGTYSLSDASLLRTRSKRNAKQQSDE